MNIWRDLDSEEEKKFRQWVHENWKVGDEVNPTWHPVVRDECIQMTITESSLTDEPGIGGCYDV